MIDLDLKLHKNHFYKKIEKLAHTKQIPFIISKSMNETALLTRLQLHKQMQKDLIIRNRGYPKQTVFDKSSKNDLSVTIFHKDPNLTKQETGVTVTGKIAVPDQIRKSERQKITKAKRPSSLKTKKGVFIILDSKGTKKKNNRRKNAIRGRSMRESLGGLKPFPGIYKRTKNKVKRLYLFTRKASYDKELDFTDSGVSYYNRRFPRILRQNIDRYIGLDNL